MEGPTTSWDKRSSQYGTDCRGVLFRSFPPILNQYIHDWHIQQLIQSVKPILQNRACRILDVGCGYGRVAVELRRVFPEIELIGLDTAYPYVSQFKQSTGYQSIHSDAQFLPFRSQVFDCIIVVTVLMYLTRSGVTETLKEIFRVLKPDGVCIIIENNKSGTHFYTLFGIIPRIRSLLNKNKENTEGRYFSYGEITEELRSLPSILMGAKGCPVFTVSLLPLYGMAKISNKFAAVLLAFCKWIDRICGSFHRFSLYIAYTFRRMP
jgi:ubiquinone/menaquinone biosynthesis C-methylase UbiE